MFNWAAVGVYRAIRHPEGGEEDIAESPPLPTGFSPKPTIHISASLNKLKVLSVADEELGCLEVLDLQAASPVLVVPTERRPIPRLPKLHLLSLDSNHLVLGEIFGRAIEGRGMVSREL